MSKDRKPERELWLLLLGASLAGKAAREEVLEGVADDEPVDADLRRLLKALREYDGKDGKKVEQSLEGFGVRVNGRLLASIKDKCRLWSQERSISEQVLKVSAARINEKVFWEQVDELKRRLGVQG